MTKQKKLYFISFSILILIILGITSCKVTDLRTDLIKNANDSEITKLRKKGKELLHATYLKQGLDKFETHQNYEFLAHESWTGMLGKMANPWGVNDVDMKFQYRINSFDGRVEILSGKKAGNYLGMQSWKYYEGDNHSMTPNFEVEQKSKRMFAISAFHYFAELLVRLQTVPVIEYAGTKKIGENSYDMVLATWGENSTPTKDHDQYLVFINQKTGLVDLCSYSAHEGHLPGISYLNANIHFSNYQEIDGVLIPMVQEGTLLKPKAGKEPVHRLEICSFKFDVVPDSLLFPNPDLPKIGDDKI